MYALGWDDDSSLGLSSAVVFVLPGCSLQASDLFSTLSTYKDHLTMKFSQNVDRVWVWSGWGGTGSLFFSESSLGGSRWQLRLRSFMIMRYRERLAASGGGVPLRMGLWEHTFQG